VTDPTFPTGTPDDACHRCGAARDGSEFCPVCDTFFAWHAPSSGAPTDPTSTMEMPAPPAPSDEAGAGASRLAPLAPQPPPYVPPVTPRATPPAPPAPPRPAATPRPADRVLPPVVTTETTEVTVTPEASGTFPLVVRNPSTIVEAYDVVLVGAPAWLSLQHGDTHLLPDESRPVVVTLAIAPGALALAQRLVVTVRIHSGVDTERSADVTLLVVVPRSGPPATLTARPILVRLHDADRGEFGLRLDNRSSNHPRRYTLSAVDPEGVVRTDFAPPVVEVPAGGVAEATARFVAPPPAPGQEEARQLTVTATDEVGPVTAQVTVAQSTTAERQRVPVKLRLEPSQVALVDQGQARLDVVVDNRAGHDDVVVHLRGHDPANALGFGFDHDGFTVGAGRAVRLGMEVRSHLAPPGQTVTRPFTVVAHAAGLETEIAGTLELTSRAAAVTTAAVRLVPDHLVVRSRKGTFRVEVDNRRGAEPLHVLLSGSDEFGRASFHVTPTQLTVAPGQVGIATAVVTHAKPEGGSSDSRKVRITAASGAESLQAEAVFTQESDSYRRAWAYLVAVLGVVLVGLGAFLEVHDLGLDTPEAVTRAIVDEAQSGSMPSTALIRAAVAIVSLALVLLGLVMMLFGLVGTTGRGLRVGGVFAALFSGAAIAALMAEGVGGFWLAIAGAVIAFVGGIMIRSARS
jgi:hypothetical protein